VLEIRRLNEGIDDRREKIIQEYIDERSKTEPNLLRSLDDYDRWKRASDIRNPKKSQVSFLRNNLMRNFRERSNGESALSFFVDSIKGDTLYLLDEPENSLSAENQLQLKYFIEDCVRTYGCQFIISTHSPFLLSLEHATIYDIDEETPRTKKWTELASVKAYHSFFKDNEWKFDP
jgi:predicted ATPase